METCNHWRNRSSFASSSGLDIAVRVSAIDCFRRETESLLSLTVYSVGSLYRNQGLKLREMVVDGVVESHKKEICSAHECELRTDLLGVIHHASLLRYLKKYIYNF
jgi:hypothetical protein